MVKNTQPRFFYGYTVAIAGMFIMAIMWGTFSTFGVFFKPMLTEFGWTRAMTSGAYSFGVLISGLAVTMMLVERCTVKIISYTLR